MAYEWKDDWLGKGNKKYFGKKDYAYHIKQGATDEEILEKLWANQQSLKKKDRYLKHGKKGLFRKLQFKLQKQGRNAQAMGGNLQLGDIKDWNYGLYGSKDWFTKGDIIGARKSGASEYHIGQLFDQAEAMGIRTSAYAREQRAALPQSDYKYGELGGWGFDKADVESFGDDLEGMTAAYDWAKANDVYIDYANVEPMMRDARHSAHQRELAVAQTARDEEAAAAAAAQTARDEAATAARDEFQANLDAQLQQTLTRREEFQEQMNAQIAALGSYNSTGYNSTGSSSTGSSSTGSSSTGFRGSSSTGVGGVASLRGSRFTKSGGRSGANRFARSARDKTPLRPVKKEIINKKLISGDKK